VYRATDDPAGDETDPLHDPLTSDRAEPEDYAGAKVACENLVLEALGDGAVVARAGLIGGRGDRSDRFGYYPAAFARAGSGAVLLPAVGETTVQTVSAADLAAWLVAAGEGDASGVYDTYGEPIAFADLVALARRSEEHTSELQSRENLVCRLLLEKKKLQH